MTQPTFMLRSVSTFAICCAFGGYAIAQDIGDEIVVRTNNATLRPDKGQGSSIDRGEVVLVLKTEKDRLFVRLPQGTKGQLTGWINRADVHALPEGIETYSNELKQRPTAVAYAIRGTLWAAQHEYDKAIADFDEAIRLNPKQAKVYSDRGTARWYQRQFDQAITDCTEAIRLDPQFAAAYVRRAYAWRNKGKYDKAMADCDEALRINSSFAAAHTARAAAWVSWKQYGPAISESNEAIRLDPNLAMALRGSCLRMAAQDGLYEGPPRLRCVDTTGAERCAHVFQSWHRALCDGAI